MCSRQHLVWDNLKKHSMQLNEKLSKGLDLAAQGARTVTAVSTSAIIGTGLGILSGSAFGPGAGGLIGATGSALFCGLGGRLLFGKKVGTIMAAVAATTAYSAASSLSVSHIYVSQDVLESMRDAFRPVNQPIMLPTIPSPATATPPAPTLG
jgi:hypothetical protein